MLIFSVGITSCSFNGRNLTTPTLNGSKEDPSLSGNGQKLAYIIDKNGRPTVQLIDVQSGRLIPLRHLSRYQPHSSPSLSWNARYIAVVAQKGSRRRVIIEDRLRGRHHQLPIPLEKLPVRISLAPDASKLALQIVQNGKWRIELYDLTGKLDLDQLNGFATSPYIESKNP